MTAGSLAELLASWRSGACTLEQLEEHLAQRFAPTATVDAARIDLDRARRCGFPEVIYGPGKSGEQLVNIVRSQQAVQQASLITRCEPDQLLLLQEAFPSAAVNVLARTVRLNVNPASGTPSVLVVTAGATDRPVAEEACETATWMGCTATILADVGVAGPWRLIEQRSLLQTADALVVVAGMEGALPSVVAGWVACPVIAVPTSVGYGANLQGVAALLSMLNSCAANVAVVNIDAGFKGGYLAGMIARQTANARVQESA